MFHNSQAHLSPPPSAYIHILCTGYIKHVSCALLLHKWPQVLFVNIYTHVLNTGEVLKMKNIQPYLNNLHHEIFLIKIKILESQKCYYNTLSWIHRINKLQTRIYRTTISLTRNIYTERFRSINQLPKNLNSLNPFKLITLLPPYLSFSMEISPFQNTKKP